MAGCSAEMESFRAPDSTNMFRRLSVSSYRERDLPPVTAADLIDNGGNCAGGYVPAGGDPAAAGDPGVPLIPSAIALEMTECDVVKRAGVPDRVEIGADAGERTATLTYMRGDRPGTYAFFGGRLKSMEAVAALPEPVKTAKKGKPAKTAKSAKPTRRAAQPDQTSVQ